MYEQPTSFAVELYFRYQKALVQAGYPEKRNLLAVEVEGEEAMPFRGVPFLGHYTGYRGQLEQVGESIRLWYSAVEAVDYADFDVQMRKDGEFTIILTGNTIGGESVQSLLKAYDVG